MDLVIVERACYRMVWGTSTDLYAIAAPFTVEVELANVFHPILHGFFPYQSPSE